jgi:hypothetical protein
VFRIVKKALFDSSERKRLYGEAKTFLRLRAQRKRYVAGKRSQHDAAPGTPAKQPAESTEPVNA